MDKPFPASSENKGSVTLWLLLATVFSCLGLTLYVHPTNLNPGLPLVMGGALTAFWALYRLFRGAGHNYHWGLDLSAVLLFWVALSATQGLDSYLAQRSLATFAGSLGFLWAAQCAIRTQRDWTLAAHAFVAFTTAVSLLAWPKALVVALRDGSLPVLTGTFVNPDTFSVLPLLGLSLGLGLFGNVRKGWAIALSVELAFLFLTILATGCRASLLGFGLAAVAFFSLSRRRGGSSHLRTTQFLLGLPLLLLLLWLPLSNLGFSELGKYTRVFSAASLDQEGTRQEVYTRGWKAVALHPGLGAGPGCFGLSFQSVRAPGHDNLYINIAHNDYIEMAVELGVAGFLLWMALLFACFSKLYQALRDHRVGPDAAGAYAALMAGCVFATFQFVVAERPALWAQVLIFGLALSFPSPRPTTREPTSLRYTFSLGVAALALWTVGFGSRAMLADDFARKSHEYAEKLQVEKAMEELDKAIELQPNRVSLRLDRAKLEESWGAFYPAYDDLSPRKKQLLAANASSPANIAVLLSLADLEILREDFPAAERFLLQAQTYAPHHKNLREKRLALAIRQAHWSDAVDLVFKEEADEARNSRLTSLLISQELQQPGAAAAALAARLEGPTREDALASLDRVLEACRARKLWVPGLSFAKLDAKSNGGDLCSLTREAFFIGKTQGSKSEWDALQKVMNATSPQRETCYSAMVQRWMDLGIALGQTQVVERRLQADLKIDARLIPARVALSELLLARQKKLEAIAMIREGLETDPRSLELLKQLAKLYEQSGSLDLALNYYKEASSLAPEDDGLTAKIAEVAKRVH